jgi:hypothetical protein
MAALAPVVRSSSAPTAVGVFSSLKLQAAGWVLAVGATSVAAVVVVQSPSETPTVVGAFHSPERSEPKSRTRAAEPTGSHVEAPDAPSSTPGVDDGPDELEQTGASPAIPARRSKRTPSPAAVETAPELELEPEPQPSPEPTASSIASEVDLLKRSRRALRRRAYGRALALLDEHARRFPHGVLRVDRIASRVEAYCGLDRVAEAKRHAARLVDQAPRNLALIDRVEATCAGAPSSVAQPRIAGAAIVRSRGP